MARVQPPGITSASSSSSFRFKAISEAIGLAAERSEWETEAGFHQGQSLGRMRDGEQHSHFGSQAPFLFSHWLSYEIRLQRHPVCGFPMGWRGYNQGAAGILITCLRTKSEGFLKANTHRLCH